VQKDSKKKIKRENDQGGMTMGGMIPANLVI